MAAIDGAEPQGLGKSTIAADLIAGLVVFLVALPLCLGIALASKATGISEDLNVPLFAGLVSGIVGGLVVGVLSGSHTSVSGPAAGLTAVIAMQIGKLGSFEAFLLAVAIAGILQIAMGTLKAGFLAEFIPSSVINGLLAAIGLILILKQLPHLFGHDAASQGEFGFFQRDDQNTFSELMQVIGDLHVGAIAVGLTSLAILIGWGQVAWLKKSFIPSALVVVIVGVLMGMLFETWGDPWRIGSAHLVDVPVAESVKQFASFLTPPDISQWRNPAIYLAAVTIALVASLETLLNIEAVDRIDPLKRSTPPSRELVAQGVGNLLCGCLGGLPVTSVIVRSSVNIHAGARTRASAIFHGLLLAGSVTLAPQLLNRIPLSALAAILIVTGFKLASPKLFRSMYSEGWYQFLPFVVTVVAIVLTDLLVGILIGLAIGLAFILRSNLRRPIRKVVERYVAGEVLRIELANQVSFLNRASLARTLREVPRGGHVLIDATHSDYIDPDILHLIAEFRDETAPVHGVELSLKGFRKKYDMPDDIRYVDYANREVQASLSPKDVLQLLEDGNERFRTGKQLSRDLTRQLDATSAGQFPLAALLTCIDSRTPAELIFDLGLGDIFTVRIAGNVAKEKVFGSLEYACAVAGAKLVVVIGHTRCGAVGAALKFHLEHRSAKDATGCDHLDVLLKEIQKSIPSLPHPLPHAPNDKQREALVDKLAEINVQHTMNEIRDHSQTLRALEKEGRIAIVGAIYEVQTGQVHWIDVFADSQHAVTV